MGIIFCSGEFRMKSGDYGSMESIGKIVKVLR